MITVSCLPLSFLFYAKLFPYWKSGRKSPIVLFGLKFCCKGWTEQTIEKGGNSHKDVGVHALYTMKGPRGVNYTGREIISPVLFLFFSVNRSEVDT